MSPERLDAFRLHHAAYMRERRRRRTADQRERERNLVLSRREVDIAMVYAEDVNRKGVARWK